MPRETKPDETGAQKVSPKTRFQFTAMILAAVIAAVLYGMGPIGGKSDRDASRPMSAGATDLKPYAIGAMQNFVPADTPLDLKSVSFVDGEGTQLSLEDFRGRVVLLNLWATWCGPCREEMPALDALQAELGSPDFEVLALSLDRGGIDKPRAFLEEIGVTNLALYHDETGRMNVQLGAFGLPTTLLLDRQGRSLGRLVGPAHWETGPAVALIQAALGEAEGEE
jgi:thiol-disulfide isomerase/thioredoxin